MMRIFTDSDYEIVTEAVTRLPALQRQIVRLRFWDGLMAHEIGIQLGLRIDSVERELRSAFAALRNDCLSQERFSRSHSDQIMAA